jgi:hypothetical protein
VAERQDRTPSDTTATPSPGVTVRRPTTADVALSQGYGIAPGYPLLPDGQALADGTPVRVDRDDWGDLGLYWSPPGHPTGWTISLQSEQGCTGEQSLPLATLMKIANALR